MSGRLLGCVRQGDVVARLGGDEFAIIQANVRDPDETEALAARIVDTVSKPYEIAGQRIDISTSIGMTLAPRDGADADQLMKNADLALYRAKADGRQGYSFFEPQMNDHIQVRRRMEIDLRKAFDNEELALLYQPIICLETQRVTGFEALMRWTHPKRGEVPPAEFIALAEEIGLISELGEWALRQACTQAARWSAPVKVAINLSPLQIKRDLIEVVLQALAASGLPPERLELEITESVLLQDSRTPSPPAPAAPARACASPWTISAPAICSLSYLRSFPFDKIKIDRAFIADIDRSAESRAIVEAIVRLGQCLGMATVAEGIENFEQLKLVCAHRLHARRRASISARRLPRARSSACSTAPSRTPATPRDAAWFRPSPRKRGEGGAGQALSAAMGLPTGSSVAAFDQGRWLTAATRHRPGAPGGLR